MASVADARQRYAKELRDLVGIEHPALVRAFASVPREAFLGPGPWRLIDGFTWTAETTPDTDPCRVYRNVLVSIDPERQLNNGSPALWARLFDVVGVQPGERVVHVGAGTGYYSAVLAELTGREGSVISIEIDTGLAERARRNLAPWPWLNLICGDGTRVDPGTADVIVVNAGATHPAPIWLERLADGGRMLLPLTTDAAVHGWGFVLLIERGARGLAARFVSPVGIFPCAGARDPDRNKRLTRAYASGTASVSSVRTEPHEADESCWMHSPGFCVSTLAVG